jgi:hypothetical protein
LVLDPLGRWVLPGAAGELYLGGVAPGIGYIDASGVDPLTMQRFVQLTADAGRYYRTGDIVTLVGGELRFLRRTDAQLKIRGHRVEPGEVTAVLLRHPAVRDCAVDAVPAGTQGHVLVAYVVAAADHITESELVEHARADLPEYSVPSRVVFLDGIPLNHNGKLDRASLPWPAAAGPSETGAGTASATERMLMTAWQDVLGCPIASSNMSFFDAGGNSLLLLPLYLRLRRAVEHHFALHDLFRFPTVRRFAEFLEGLDNRTAAPADPRRQRTVRTPDQIHAAAIHGRLARGRENSTNA